MKEAVFWFDWCKYTFSLYVKTLIWYGFGASSSSDRKTRWPLGFIGLKKKKGEKKYKIYIPSMCNVLYGDADWTMQRWWEASRMMRSVLSDKWTSKNNNKRKNIAVRVHVALRAPVTRIGTFPPMARLRFQPRDYLQPVTAGCCGRAPARGRARSVRII